MKIELSKENWELVYKFIKEVDQDDVEKICGRVGIRESEKIDYSLWALYEELRVAFKKDKEEILAMTVAEEKIKEGFRAIINLINDKGVDYNEEN